MIGTTESNLLISDRMKITETVVRNRLGNQCRGQIAILIDINLIGPKQDIFLQSYRDDKGS